ncbi:MAG: class I SAM-dependent methyltransferase [Coxiellaceae bacterium]|nr:class I SAM-dependent methyltransferase [Coxiellaceae bacterium]
MYKLKPLNHRLALVDEQDPDSLGKPISVDFADGAIAHRIEQGGGKKQLLGKAIGCHKHKALKVVDATAGLGRDSFVLASLGCQVTSIERHPDIYALLQDGYQRAVDAGVASINNMQIVQGDTSEYLASLSDDQTPDVVYIDPMYPHSNKSALVKKEMRILRQVVGDDHDNSELLDTALQHASYRVVVKRPIHAPTLTDRQPNFDYKGKKSRFDIYLPA